ncbi:hypothetical protein LguiB_009063 [Lonicera macranthoides]
MPDHPQDSKLVLCNPKIQDPGKCLESFKLQREPYFNQRKEETLGFDLRLPIDEVAVNVDVAVNADVAVNGDWDRMTLQLTEAEERWREGCNMDWTGVHSRHVRAREDSFGVVSNGAMASDAGRYTLCAWRHGSGLIGLYLTDLESSVILGFILQGTGSGFGPTDDDIRRPPVSGWISRERGKHGKHKCKKSGRGINDDDNVEAAVEISTPFQVCPINGLFFMYYGSHGTSNDDCRLALWNPATTKFRVLPPPILNTPPHEDFAFNFGFGLDLFTGDFKAVRIPYISGDGSLVQLYSLANDS